MGSYLDALHQSNLYFITGHEDDERCIIPLGAGIQCRREITRGQLKLAKRLTAEARVLAKGGGYAGPKFDRKMEKLCYKLVMRRTCDKHWQTLSGLPSCVRHVAERYRRLIKEKANSDNIKSCSSSGELRVQYSPPSSPRIKQANVRTIDVPQATASKVPRFVRYKTIKPRYNTDKLVEGIINLEHTRTSGQVYAINWPEAPGYIKIGSSCVSAASRRKAWQKCHAGARILLTVDSSFPKLLERLLHLDIKSKRHQIVCSKCGRTHHEWFKISEYEVIKCMATWQGITERYDPNDPVSKSWLKAVRECLDREVIDTVWRPWLCQEL